MGEMKLHDQETVVAKRMEVEGFGVSHTVTRRVVPGGWLYTTVIMMAEEVEAGAAIAVSTAFVPEGRS